ncbi:MAG: alpha/beta fold hydrolase, partial [Deltaproteobacteria bacterium]|nr:alpha/beta fold hydrolase [Deltaproteobacteria bacterium]
DESWYTEWWATADRVRAIGQSCLAAGHKVSAREAFCRASMYYRSAEFFLHGDPADPRILETWHLSRDSFRQAAALMDHPVEAVKIPYEDTFLPGYVMRPDDSLAPRKTLIVQTGFDGTGEELYFEVGFFALARGYNVLIFEGPGQGGPLRAQHLYFRPDWEKVITPVVDFALSRPEFDPKRLAILGISMGGYMVVRGAAFERRLTAVVANPGSYDLLEGRGHGQKEREVEGIRKHPEEANKALRQKMKTDAGLRWAMNNGMFTFGKSEPTGFILALAGYGLKDTAPLVRCPTLVIQSQDEQAYPGQAKQLYQALTCPKTLMPFTRKDMASWHCQMGALAISNQRIFDWLDKTLAGGR